MAHTVLDATSRFLRREGMAARVISRYLADRVARGDLARSSAEVIRVVLHQWWRHVDQRPPSSWTEADVLAWLNDDNLRPSTRKSRVTKLRPFIRWLIDEGEMDHDPTSRIGRIRVPIGNPRDFTVDEVQALLHVCPDRRAVLIVLLMVQMGLRCGDVARIRVEDVDARRRSIHVRGKGGRGEPTHWVPVPNEAWNVLARWLHDLRRSAGPVIASYHTGEQLQPATVSKMVGEWVKQAGLKDFPWDGRSAHSLRHSCAQHMLDIGAGLREVQFALGHRSQRTTEIYTRHEPRGLRDAIEGRQYLAS